MKRSLRNVVMIVLALCLLVCPAMAELVPEETMPVAVLKAGITLEGTLPKTADEFEIVLESEGDCPMPDENTIAITGEGKGAFEITFDHVGVYNYTIKQVQKDYENMKSLDTSVYHVTVYCTNVDPQNVDGRLEVSVVMYRNNESEKDDEAIFHNVYKTVKPTTEPGTVTPTGVQDYWMYYLALCAVMLVASGALLKVVCTKERTVKVEDGDDEQ